jgi:hypothetical protein
MNVAAAGVQAGMTRFQASAVQAVKAAQPNSNENLPAAMVRVTTNSLAVKADIGVLKMADKTVGTLLDTMA